MSDFTLAIMIFSTLAIVVRGQPECRDHVTCQPATELRCIARPSCGLPQLTTRQKAFLKNSKTQKRIRELEITGPTTLNEKFIELTEEQKRRLIECFGYNLLRLRDPDEPPYDKQRSRRSTGGNVPCCPEGDSTIRITHSVFPNGPIVEVIQINDVYGQEFPDATSCRDSICGGKCASLPYEFTQALVVDITSSYQFLLATIRINICGAVLG